MTTIPVGWEKATLRELGESIKGSVQPAADRTYELYSVPSFGDATPEILRGSDIGSHKRPVKPADLLICKINPRINRVWSVGPTAAHEQLASPEWLVFRTPIEQMVEMLRYQLSAPDFRRWIESGVHGVTGSHTRAKDDHILDYVVRVPPLAEQGRIVDTIEEALSKLDAGEAGLQAVRRLLRRMRTATIEAAVGGCLVAQDPTELPPPEHLVAPSGRKLGELPNGWARATVGDLLARVEAGKSFATEGRPAGNGEVGVIKVSAMTWGSFRPEENKTIPKGSVIEDRWVIRGGDLLFSRANTSDYVGACVIVPHDFSNLILSDKSLRLVPHDFISREWLQLSLRSRAGRRQIEALASGTKESMRNISQAKLRSIEVRVPPLEEQTRIVAEVDRQISFVDACDRAVGVASTRSAGLRRSVLTAAFEGRLVSQDPGEEPAAALLKRLSADGVLEEPRRRTQRSPRAEGRPS